MCWKWISLWLACSLSFCVPSDLVLFHSVCGHSPTIYMKSLSEEKMKIMVKWVYGAVHKEPNTTIKDTRSSMTSWNKSRKLISMRREGVRQTDSRRSRTYEKWLSVPDVDQPKRRLWFRGQEIGKKLGFLLDHKEDMGIIMCTLCSRRNGMRQEDVDCRRNRCVYSIPYYFGQTDVVPPCGNGPIIDLLLCSNFFFPFSLFVRIFYALLPPQSDCGVLSSLAFVLLNRHWRKNPEHFLPFPFG